MIGKSKILIHYLFLMVMLLTNVIQATTLQDDYVQKSYIAYYARPADPSGLSYWIERLNQNNGDIQGIIDSFGDSEEYTSRFSSLSNTELVNNIYQNLFGRDADPSGLAFYVNWLDTGQSSLAKIALNILDGASGDDVNIINNKLIFAYYYTSLVELNSINYDLSSVVETLTSITALPNTIETAKQQIKTLIKKSREINDTGIMSCGNYTDNDTFKANNYLACSLLSDTNDYLIPRGQDGHYGRDLFSNDYSDGHAGFSFTKLDRNGKKLSNQSASYTDLVWSCVKDNITGLIWEVKTLDSDLHGKKQKFSWLNSDMKSNGGDKGDAGGGYIGDEVKCDNFYVYNNIPDEKLCNIENYVNITNKNGWCGANDWRVPTKEEMMSIISYAHASPAIDKNFFPNTPSGLFWTNSPYPVRTFSGNYRAWTIDQYGSTAIDSKNGRYYVRLVRGGK